MGASLTNHLYYPRLTMSTDYRALCAELLPLASSCLCAEEMVDSAVKSIDRARTALAQPESDPSQLSDGFHTFAELYEHRHALCLALMRAMPEHCWFSWRHADGKRCFGGDDWFIAGIELPAGASVTYHMPAELFQIAQATGAAELEKGRPWDGHSAADVVLRLKAWAALAQPEPEGATDEELDKVLFQAVNAYMESVSPFGGPVDQRRLDRAKARAVLTRWGRPAIEPVPVSERLPRPEDCTAQGWCWVLYRNFATWTLEPPLGQDGKHTGYTHWLPHHALPTPAP
jgi:hypothetical protein